ncbi:F-box protein At2g02240-like [Ananas comosus]|uniref:F-box protein At2g02240-like n=1 Tax=Ananas comosus TaxID=4615 RepID=A0A6P5H3S2_ANACO|nr:F-box protein At2g02240-like [Ananas comosus]
MEEGVGVGEFSRVPEGCIAHVISLTSPRDACRLSVVSAAFRSAAASDAVWQRFLPPDFPSILSRAAAAAAVDLGCSSKKDLFFRLCHHPLLLLHAPTPISFWLDKSSGAKCYMLLARALSIAWGDTPEYWAWNRIPDARFGEVAELLDVCWLEIVGRIGSSALSPKTAYAAYLVFKIADDWHGLHCPKQETCVTLGGVESKHTVCLQPDAGTQQIMSIHARPFWRKRTENAAGN